jgi:arylformamidase
MTPRLIDISMPLNASTPTWPASPGFSSRNHLALADGDVANATQLGLDVHCGTHVDAPRHFIADGATIDEVGLTALVGTAWVADVTGHRDISADVLDASAIPDGTRRLLLATDNASRPDMYREPFREDYVALTPDAAAWVARRPDIRLVGIDYLSIQRYADPPEVHMILLGAGVLILEGIDLRVTPGPWTLMCLPLCVTGVEAAPARAVLLEDGWRA